MGARLYNPTTAHFTTPDPIPGGNTTPYTYPQNPVTDSDTSGTCNINKWWCIKGIMQGRKSLPGGFLRWTKRSGLGSTTYIWYRPDGVRRRGLIGDRCTRPAPDCPLGYNLINSCDTHDLGYALMRWFGRDLVPWSLTKARIDNRFLGDMRAQCAVYSFWHRQNCRNIAAGYYTVVRFYNPDL
jgi:hypothetical protein